MELKEGQKEQGKIVDSLDTFYKNRLHILERVLSLYEKESNESSKKKLKLYIDDEINNLYKYFREDIFKLLPFELLNQTELIAKTGLQKSSSDTTATSLPRIDESITEELALEGKRYANEEGKN